MTNLLNHMEKQLWKNIVCKDIKRQRECSIANGSVDSAEELRIDYGGKITGLGVKA